MCTFGKIPAECANRVNFAFVYWKTTVNVCATVVCVHQTADVNTATWILPQGILKWKQLRMTKQILVEASMNKVFISYLFGLLSFS